jgi:hypothetical protein
MAVEIEEYDYVIQTYYKGDVKAWPLQWQDDPPTQSGWYWEWQKSLNIEPYIIYINEAIEKSRAEKPKVLTLWMGPLPIPESPKE